MEHTTFYFEVQERFLNEGLDRFAQFFIQPLMKVETMTREREAVHSGMFSVGKYFTIMLSAWNMAREVEECYANLLTSFSYLT